MSANTSIIINIQHPQNARTINFEISLHMALRENQTPTVALLFDVLNEISTLYNDENYGKIAVRNVTCNPFVFTWSNTTLPIDYCDTKMILNLLSVSKIYYYHNK